MMVPSLCRDYTTAVKDAIRRAHTPFEQGTNLMSIEQLLGMQQDMANEIVKKLNAPQRPTAVTRAIELLLTRIVAGGNSLAVLRQRNVHPYTFDEAMIVRGIYDAMLQALYILDGAATWDERAQMYLDWYWIEKKDEIERYDSNSTFLAQRMSKSPRRPAAEPLFEKKYQEAFPKYATRRGDKTRQHWYCGTLRELAKAVTPSLESEYELLQAYLSGPTHSSVYALSEPPVFDKELLADFAWRFSYRVLGKFACYKGIALTEDEEGMIALATENVFNLPGNDDGKHPANRPSS
jgi:hypothetical protein